jgi:hypothetical protein
MLKVHSLANYKFTSSTTQPAEALATPYDKDAIGLAQSGPRVSIYAIMLIEEKAVPHVVILQSTMDSDIYSLYHFWSFNAILDQVELVMISLLCCWSNWAAVTGISARSWQLGSDRIMMNYWY